MSHPIKNNKKFNLLNNFLPLYGTCIYILSVFTQILIVELTFMFLKNMKIIVSFVNNTNILNHIQNFLDFLIFSFLQSKYKKAPGWIIAFSVDEANMCKSWQV